MKTFILILFIIIQLPASAKLYNSIYQNNKQYGPELNRVTFSDPKKPFTGYVTHKVNADHSFVVKAYYINNKARSEHLLPANPNKPKSLTRAQVKNWAAKMFASSNRGYFRRQLEQPRVKAFFFDRGLISYEYLNRTKKGAGFKTVKVLIYENDNRYYQIRGKAYI
jgi:hypothetical protein